jgi:hypothetical protein
MSLAEIDRDVVVPDDDEEWGPKMQALTERQRKFVMTLLALPDELGVLTKAAKISGYGTPSSSQHVFEQIGSRLWNSPRVRDAFYEHGRRDLARLGLRALKGLDKILDAGVEHKDFYKAVRMALGYCWPLEQQINVTHEHRISQEEGEELARRMAAELGVSIERLLGASSVPPVIEGQAAACDTRSESKDAEGRKD